MGFFGSLEAIRVKIAEILQIVIINNSFIHINLWSVVHLISGFLVAWILYHFFKKKDKITILNTLWILVIYEVFELLAFEYLSFFFETEIYLDTFWDIIIGMVGAGLFLLLKNRSKKDRESVPPN